VAEASNPRVAKAAPPTGGVRLVGNDYDVGVWTAKCGARDRHNSVVVVVVVGVAVCFRGGGVGMDGEGQR